MSLLLGVGGADRRNEVQSFREDIRHQPESQYNSDFSIYRSTSSLQPIWRELPVADEILSSSSSTAIDPGSSTSAAFRTRSGMTEEKHWQDTQKNDTVRAEGFNPSKAEGYRYISSGAQPNGKLTNTYRGLESPILPSNFGYSPQSASRSNENMNSFTFSARNPQELVKNSNSTLDERLRRSDMDPGFTQKNEKSWKLGTSDAEANSPLRNSSRPSCTTHQKFTSEARATQVLENEAVVFPGSNKPTYSGDIADSKQAYTEKKTPEVFVFGASSGENSFKSSEAQQKLFQSSFIKPSSKSRVSKFKRHSNSMKGKGLAPIGGSGIQQFAPTFSREASPESVTGSATESSQLDEAECSDTGIWQREKVDERIAREKNELLRSEYMQEENSGAVTQNEQRGLLHRGSEENPPQSEPLCQDSGSTDPKTQENHSLHLHERHNLTNWQALSARFGSWWPFQSKVETDSMEDWEADGSSKTSNEIRISTQFDDTPNEPNTTLEQQEAGGLNPSTTNLKPSESNLQSSLDGFIDSTKPPDGEGADFKFSGTFSGKESTQKSSNGTNDMVWNFGAKDPGQPFVFGAAQHQATHSGQSLTPGACASIGSRVSPSSTSFPLGTSFGPALYKGPTAMSNHTPVTRITSNPDSLKGVNLPSFTELKKEGPTGEFSGPLSCSESSASEGSPSRPEPWQASDKPFYQVHCFQFQGGVKDERDAPSALGKTKSETSSRVRRHAGRLSRSRRAALSASSKNISTPMEFSPIVNSTELSSGSVTLEQPYLSFSETDPMDDGDLPRQLSDFQNMPEPASGSATLNVDTNEGVSAFQARSQDSENLNDWNEPNIFSSKRSGKWKRRGLDEGQSPPSFQRAHGLDGHPEGARSAIDDHTSKINANIHEPIFIFGASSSHTSSNSMQENVALRSQKEKNTEPLEELGADKTVFVPNLDQDRQPHLKPGPAFPYPLVSTDKISLSGVSMSRSNQSYTHVRNFEDSAALNHHFSDGIMGTANAVKSAAAEQVCERWRLRGNQAYAIGDFPKAEEYYSRGANSVSPNETSQSCIRASMLCYSNRAATRMAVGRMREALADCNRAMVVDPGFLRVRLRAASCHLALGESKAAVEMFKECLKYAKENSKSDPKIVVEAMEGVKKSQQLDDYSDRALELLEKQTFVDSTSALRLLNEALSISTFSEPLHELKAQALLSLRRYDECLQFCEQTLPAAERNHGYAVHEKNKDSFLREACQSSQNGHLKLWRWKLSAKALYNLGKLEESLELLVKHEEVSSTGPADKGTDLDSLTPFLANLRDQLRHKVAGNEAFQLGKHAEAVEHYTAALACNSDSRPFNAVCFCNRAAAWQALGHLADAIADCSRAIALDAVYPKALSRRATLHEMIRDHGQACNDLRRLISLLEDQNNETSKGTGSNIYTQDLRQAKERLEKEEEEMKKGHPIDHYLVLGVDFSCSANEIKKAYRKAALKHHPDKAGQFLARSETGDDGGLWNEVGDEVCRDAERLFKLIGEAYGILSDATKRLRYDTEEENRKLRGKDGSNLGSSSEGYRSQHEKSSRRQQRDRWDAWQGFAPQHQRWQSGPDAAQPDTYGHRTTYSGDPAKAGKTTWSTDFF